MAVSYILPAERAWARTRRVLMQPFDVERWIVIGFAAFLAGLAGQWTGLSFTPRWRFRFPPDWDQLVAAPFENLIDAFQGSTWFLFGLPFVLFAVGVGVALLWLSSRGKLIFLENMVRGRGAFVDPWKRFRQLGNSLFFWRLGFCLAAVLVAGVALWPMVLLGRGLGGSGFGRPFGALISFGAGVGALTLGIVVAYVGLFLESFIVPLIYRREATAVEAWRLFLPLLRARPAEFLAYGVIVLVAGAGVFLCLIAAAIVTCCVLPALLSVPYVSSVLLLPLTGFFRLYSVEFLAQFGSEYELPGGDAPEEPREPTAGTRHGSDVPDGRPTAPEGPPPDAGPPSEATRSD